MAIEPSARRRTGHGWLPFLSYVSALALFLFLRPGVGQDMPSAVSLPGSVTAGTLEAKIAEVEAATGTQEEAKAKLLELYRRALGNLKQASSNAEAAEVFRLAGETAPAEVQAIRDAMAETAKTPPEDTLELDDTTSLRQIEQLLQKEKADFAAVDAKRAELEKRLAGEAGRPALIRERLSEAREEQEKVAAQLGLAPQGGEGPATAEARRWALETRSAVLSTEIKLLDQELLSQPMRLDLLEAKRDRAAASVQWVGTRVKLLEESLNRKRREEAQEAKAEAEAIRREAQGGHPLVAQLAEQSAALSEELARMAARLETLAEETERTDTLARQVKADFQSAREAVEAAGLSHELGHMLHRQRESLPDLRAHRRAAGEREDLAAEVALRRLRHLEEGKRLGDLDAYMAETLAKAAAEETPMLREQLRELAAVRRGLLKKAIEEYEVYQGRLGELETAQQRLREGVEDYDAFLDEHLLWVRSTSLFQLENVGTLLEQMRRVLSPAGWREVAQALAYQATHSPVFALLAVALAVLLVSRRRMNAMLRGLSERLGKPTTDRFGYTALALVLTLAAAAVWPLVMLVIGWQLKVSAEATDYTTAVGASLIAVSVHFFHLRALRLACTPRGLAAAHFRWPEASLHLLRTELDLLSWVFVPSILLVAIAAKLDPLNFGWAIGRVAFLIAVGALTFALYRLLHPERGVFAGYLRRRQTRIFRRLYPLGYPLLLGYPVALGVLSVFGFLYTAGVLTTLFLETLWFVAELVLLAALAERWLLITRRRLAYEAAMERRESEAEERRTETARRSGEEGSPLEAEEPEIDVLDLSDRSRKLVNTAILFFGLFGLWLIWSDVFPALRILDQVTLWHHRVTVDGEELLQAVTLASMGRALMYAAITILLAKQLPAVLEIILLQYTGMSAGGRYTFTTLTNYAIFTIGLGLVLKTLGADWSQLQWLVAALGVGIGFGLQEIVANFISGIIILFERPIRIGDVVTVGETDGVVTRIRSRATTIRNWDGKELLVPNKEFITGRLLNWSLSDQATRIMLSVGIAYGSNVREAMRLLEDAARENDNVLDDPAPSVIFETFGDNSLGLILRCFVDSVDRRYPTLSALNEAINDKFSAAGIVIAFPQRDLHLDTIRPLQVEVRHSKDDSRDEGAGQAGGAEKG